MKGWLQLCGAHRSSSSSLSELRVLVKAGFEVSVHSLGSCPAGDRVCLPKVILEAYLCCARVTLSLSASFVELLLQLLIFHKKSSIEQKFTLFRIQNSLKVVQLVKSDPKRSNSRIMDANAVDEVTGLIEQD